MKTLFIILLIFISTIVNAQISDAKVKRVANATTAFSENLPVGTQIYDANTDKLYVTIASVLSSATLTNASSSFKELFYSANLIPVSDVAYNATSWNANTDAATKNAIRDQVETIWSTVDDNTAFRSTPSTEITAGTNLTWDNNILNATGDGTGTDNQALILTGDVLTIEDGSGSVNLANYVDDVDASVTNEGTLTVGAGTATTSLIQSNTSGSTAVTLEAGANISLSEAGNTITINVDETDMPNYYCTDWTGVVTAYADIKANYSGGVITVGGAIIMNSSVSWDLSNISFEGNDVNWRFYNANEVDDPTIHTITITAGSPSFSNITFWGSAGSDDNEFDFYTTRNIFIIANTSTYAGGVSFNSCSFNDIVGAKDKEVIGITGGIALHYGSTIEFKNCEVSSHASANFEYNGFKVKVYGNHNGGLNVFSFDNKRVASANDLNRSSLKIVLDVPANQYSTKFYSDGTSFITDSPNVPVSSIRNDISQAVLTTSIDADDLILYNDITTNNVRSISRSNFLSGISNGDMLKSVYDPTNIEDDAFDMDNMVEGTTSKIMTNTERTNFTAGYNDKINSLAISGTSTKTLTLTQQDAGTVSNTWTDLVNDADADSDNENQDLTWTDATNMLTISNGDGTEITGFAESGDVYTSWSIKENSDPAYPITSGETLTFKDGADIEVIYADGTGIAQWNFTGTIPSGNQIIDWTVTGAEVIHTDRYVENYNHTGDVSGATALSINDNVVENVMLVNDEIEEVKLAISNTPSNGKFLQYKDATDKLTWASPSGSSPLTTKGDVYTYSTVDARLGVGSDDQVLTADASEPTGLKWATASGSGNVTKVNTPVDNQVGVWTGDGTIEGDPDLTFDGTDLNIRGDLKSKTQTNTVQSGSKLGNFTHDGSLGDIGAYRVNTETLVLSIYNLSSGMQGTVFIEYHTTTPTILTVNTYSDSGTSGLTEVTIGAASAPAINKVTSITYTCANNGTSTEVFLIYGQEE